MVSNPFQEEASVVVSSDTSGFNLGGARSSLLNFKNAVGATGAALSALAVGGLAKSASAAADFEEAMAEVQKVSDAETMEELREPIQEMAEEIPLAAEEIAGLSAQAARFGVEGSENIEKFTRTAAEMGAATTLAADEAGRSLAKVATALDEPLENVRELGDSINELSNNFATSSQEIVDAAQRGGFAVENLGLQSDEILALSAALNEVAPTARRAGNMMKQLGEALVDPDNVEAFAEALDVTTEEFIEMREENPQGTLLAVAEATQESDEATQELSETLTTQQVRAFQRAGQNADQYRDALETSNQAMREGGSLAREVAIETDTLKGQMNLLQSQINNVFREIGQNLVPALRELNLFVSNGVERLSELNKATDGLAGTYGLLTTAIVGTGAALTAFIGGPATLAIGTMVAGAAAIFKAWDENFAGIQDIVEELGKRVEEILPEIERSINTFVEGLDVEEIIESFEEFAVILEDQVKQNIEALGPVFSDLETFLGDNQEEIRILGEFVGDLIRLWIGYAQTIVKIVGPIFRQVIIPLIRGVIDLLDIMLSQITRTIELGEALQEGDFERAQVLAQDLGEGAIEGQLEAVETSIEATQGAVQAGEEIKIELTGDTDVIEEVSAETVKQRERRTNRNSGRTSGVTR